MLRKGIDAVRAELASAVDKGERVPILEGEIREIQDRFKRSEDAGKALARRRDELTAEAAGLRANLDKTKAGRALVALQVKLADVEAQQRRDAAAARQATEDLVKSELERGELREILKTTRHHLEEAEKRAEEESDDRVKKDNELLRGIIARQNDELEHHRREVIRMRGTHAVARLVYALVAAGVVALGFLAVKILPQIKLDGLF